MSGYREAIMYVEVSSLTIFLAMKFSDEVKSAIAGIRDDGTDANWYIACLMYMSFTSFCRLHQEHVVA